GAVAQVPIQISPRCLASALEGAAVISDAKTASADMKSIVLCGEPKRPEVRMRNRFISDRRDMQPEDFGRRIGRCQQLWAECRSNVRSSSFRKVESSAFMRHGGTRRGAVDVSKRAGPAEGSA